jgi:regulator of protease activity HflC (stomatin/prohibitin superfamily)
MEKNTGTKNPNRRYYVMGEQKPWVYVVAGLALLFIFFSFGPFAIIQPGHRGVIVRLGKVDMNRILGEGFYWKMPIITDIKKMTVQIQKSEMDADAATKDLQTVRARVAINWKLDPEKVNTIYQTIGDEQDVLGDIMHPAINEVLKAACAKRNAEEILVQRESLKKDVDDAFKFRMEKYGIIVVDINLVNFDFSKEFNAAIEAKQVAEQQAKQALFVAKKAEADALARINQAKGEAEAQRLQRITLSGIMLKKMWIDKWDGKLPKVMTGNNSGMILDLKSIQDNEQGQ